ncbi:MAG: hypothetical protein EXR63_00015 [Dehalococcoidia bacterium]|nr:hypothetical protein [Dehalococcoidia bacterium]
MSRYLDSRLARHAALALAAACSGGARPEPPAASYAAATPVLAATMPALPQAVARTDGDDLTASVTHFTLALVVGDAAILLPYFAPEGLAQAVALQAQPAAATLESAQLRSLVLDADTGAEATIALRQGGAEALLLVSWRRIAATWLVVNLTPLAPRASR